MLFSLEVRQFSINNLFYLETKQNIIMDGNFTKVMYSNEFFTMNGIYLVFPITISSLDTLNDKRVVRFSPNNKENALVINEFSKLESILLDHYRETKASSMKTSYTLSKQLHAGCMKLYKEYNRMNQDVKTSTKKPECILKISGIWETYDEIGLTYKLIFAENTSAPK
jgi:hypothetical protein